jgi:hypothetical protein
MYLKIFIVAISLSVFAASCSKSKASVSTGNAEDSAYAKKFVELLHPSVNAAPSDLDTNNKGVSHLVFATYKDAFNFFRCIDSKDSVLVWFTVNPSTSKNSERLSVASTNDDAYTDVWYSVQEKDAAPVTGSNVLETFAMVLSDTYEIEYTQGVNGIIKQDIPEVTSYSYTGVGTLSGSSVTAKSFNINGYASVVATVAGTTFSFTISVTGSYYYTIPLIPNGGSIFYISLLASAV